MARSVRGSSAAAAGRGDRFSSAPPDYRLPTLPSGESMQQCVFLHGDLAKRPYRLEDFREPLEEAGIIKNITGIGAFQMNHIWLVKLRTKADKDALLKTGGLQVKGGFCAVIDPIQQDVTVKVHWVDFAVQNESFRQVLSNFGDVLEVSNDNWSVAGFEHATSTTRVVRMRLKEENIMDAEEAEKSAPNSNIKEHVDEVQETDAKKAGGTMPDSQDLTKATEVRAETVCTPEAPLLSQASEEEDMSDCTETTTEEEKADATGATAARGKRLRTGIPKLTEDTTERKVKRLERQWQRVAGAKGRKYVPEVRSASASPVRGQRRDK
ncbi:hypothetical protein HPB49_010681 [Dermacentor silvarum]|uniref:Uncharacterized protein n=1 Tax=Dermacentor silvarum TaxID=543639 RepID=A0ACB8DZD8_DERSI|nr:hypothetical protein HPB49_010681 [Dermacentor silvarum]